MNYNFINKINGWAVFALATIVYMLTIEDTASLWDCGEYITAAYKLEVGHPPGAPLYMILGRLFSFFAAPENVAYYINALSALSSSFTILFMFWSLTLLLKKLVLRSKKELDDMDKIGIFVSATIGSLAYAFSDSFWFSAVEGEVYAMASLFTAVIFWAILKWDEEMALLQNNQLSNEAAPNKWLLLIMFLLGLAIGVHLLGILVIPAIGYVIYFRVKDTTTTGFFVAGILSIIILGFIQEGVIPGTISLASSFEVYFVNSMGLPFYSGSLFFFALLIAFCIFGVRFSRRKNMPLLSNSLMGLVFLLIGYGSFAVIVIRSNANTPLDENDPENLVTLHSYLKREQYGSAPIVSGPYFNSKEKGGEFNQRGAWVRSDQSEWDDMGPVLLRRWVVKDEDADLKGFVEKTDAEKWMNAESNSTELELEEKYFETNKEDRLNQIPTYDDEQSTLFPRMYSPDAKRQPGYEYWSGYNPLDEGVDRPEGKNKQRLPTFGENMRYFFDYQLNWMYFRYFMWNFAGRQNDIQGHGDNMRGNWISGIPFVDNWRLGNESNAPFYTKQNKSNNAFYFIPLLFALIGLVFHYSKAPKDAFVLTLAFLFTGIAIVVYLNQKPFEPRERDYAYAGSFYFFAMWIGFGVYALIDFLKEKVKLKNMKVNIGIAGTLGLIVPLIMAVEGWDDHNRSGKTTARDLAKNYLMSCEKNGILFTFGDNDTFPLWYMQEVEGYRTDVRVCNLSLMGTDWYTNQMKMKAYESDPLPIKFTKDQILMYGGTTDVMYFQDDLYYLFAGTDITAENFKRLIALRLDNPNNKIIAQSKYLTLKSELLNIIKSRVATKDITRYINYLNKDSSSLASSIVNAYEVGKSIPVDLSDMFYRFDENWSTVDLSTMMSYMEKDYFYLKTREANGSFSRNVNLCPSTSFTLKVNKENALKAKIITKNEFDACPDNISFNISSTLQRDQIMILDILANFDWKRGIYFSSLGNDVAQSLQSYLKKNGVGYELNPMGGGVNLEKMYANLMKNYSFGNMSDPSVITDYYARRHTSTYRKLFLSLANTLYKNKDTIRALKVLDRSLSLMPADVVLGFGDDLYGQPTLQSNYDSYGVFIYQKTGANSIISSDIIGEENVTPIPVPSVQGVFDPKTNRINLSILKQVSPSFRGAQYIMGGANSDSFSGTQHRPKLSGQGTIHEYVQLYLLLGEKKKAKTLLNTLIKQYESVLNYFVKSDVEILLFNSPDQTNSDILFAALHATHMMNRTAQSVDPNGTGKALKISLSKMHKQINSLLNKARTMVSNESDEASRAVFVKKLNSIERYLEEMKIIYEYNIEKK